MNFSFPAVEDDSPLVADALRIYRERVGLPSHMEFADLPTAGDQSNVLGIAQDLKRAKLEARPV